MKIPPILTRPEFVCNKLLFVISFSTQKCDKYPVFKTQLLKFTPGTIPAKVRREQPLQSHTAALSLKCLLALLESHLTR